MNFYKKLKEKKIMCLACNRFCVIEENNVGECKIRENEKGKLKLLTYGKPSAIAIDPIEKKPLFHFFPFQKTLSFATFGCNFTCIFCQNFDISKEFVIEETKHLQEISPKEMVNIAKNKDIKIISATYTEPTVFIEYALDIAKDAKKEKMKNVWVSNGYFSDIALKEITKYVDAFNIDLKGSKEFYKKYTGNVEIERIKNNIEKLNKAKKHIEITNLLIPKLNDSKKDIEDLVNFIAEVNPKIPLHFTAFFPTYKLTNHKHTKLEKLKEAKKIADKKLEFVYVGNVNEEQNTYCPNCGRLIIDRTKYIINIEKGKCKFCNYKIYGNF